MVWFGEHGQSAEKGCGALDSHLTSPYPSVLLISEMVPRDAFLDLSECVNILYLLPCLWLDLGGHPWDLGSILNHPLPLEGRCLHYAVDGRSSLPALMAVPHPSMKTSDPVAGTPPVLLALPAMTVKQRQ